MPLVVPLLRLALVLLNVYETFKTLKPARVSQRTGRPSDHASMQRKRDMKGCVTIWLVWCSFTLLERIFDSILSIFVPFYSELKALVIIFQLAFRAAGAKPIYLHVMRPLIKPYVATCDVLLETAYTFGDFAVLIMFIPLNPILAWWNPELLKAMQEVNANAQVAPEEPIAPSPERPRASHANSEPAVRSRTKTHALGQGLPSGARAARARAVSSQSSAAAAANRRHDSSNARPRNARNASSSSRTGGSQYEIWRPPVPPLPLDKQSSRGPSGSRVSSKPSTRHASTNASRENVSAIVRRTSSEKDALGPDDSQEYSTDPAYPSLVDLAQSRRTVSESHGGRVNPAEPARFPVGYAAQTLPSRHGRRGAPAPEDAGLQEMFEDIHNAGESRSGFSPGGHSMSSLNWNDSRATLVPRETGHDQQDADGAGHSDDSTMDGDETLKTIKVGDDDDEHLDVDMEDQDQDQDSGDEGFGQGKMLGGTSVNELMTYIRQTSALLSPTASVAPLPLWDESYSRQMSISSALTSTSNEESLRTVSRKASDSSIASSSESMMTESSTAANANAEEDSDAASVTSVGSVAGVKRTASARAAEESERPQRRSRADSAKKLPAAARKQENRYSQRIQAKSSSGSDKSQGVKSKIVAPRLGSQASDDGQKHKRARLVTIKRPVVAAPTKEG